MINGLEVLSVIPARGGSKGIPRKNIFPVAGKPLISYAIENARASNFIDRVIVSTEDKEIGSVAKKYGAEVVWRPDEICGDEASSESALLHVLDYLKTKENYIPNILAFLQCTSPLVIPEDIDGTIISLIENEADTSFSVTPCHFFLWEKDSTGNAVGINHNKEVRLRRQEISLPLLETGAVYAIHVEGFIKNKHRFFGKSVMYVIPNERRFEIDDPLDVKIVDVLLEERNLNKG